MKSLTLGFIFVACVAAGPAQVRPREGLNEIESSNGYGYEKALEEEKLFQSSREWDPLTDNGKRIIRLIELRVSKSKIYT